MKGVCHVSGRHANGGNIIGREIRVCFGRIGL